MDRKTKPWLKTLYTFPKIALGPSHPTFLVMGWFGALNERLVRVSLLTPYQHIRITWASCSGYDAIFGTSLHKKRIYITEQRKQIVPLLGWVTLCCHLLGTPAITLHSQDPGLQIYYPTQLLICIGSKMALIYLTLPVFFHTTQVIN